MSTFPKTTKSCAWVVVAVWAAGGCDDSRSGPGATRSFALGFTDFPHAATAQAVADAYAVIARDADLVALHFDDGVPWQEALAGAPYDSGWVGELARKAASIPAGHLRYLAITPIALSRDRLADHRGASGNEPLVPPWDTLSFDAPQVIAAFTAHAKNLITVFEPDYFAYAIEANILAAADPVGWSKFVTLARALYASVKADHPALPIFVTLQADWFHGDPVGQAAAIAQVIPYTDVIAVSTYPFAVQPDPLALRPDHFAALAALAPTKPFVVSETGWPAEDVTAPYPVVIPSDDTNQRRYVERLLADAEALSAGFVVWFFTRDFDDLWDAQLQFLPGASLFRLWKDCGLYDGAGGARPALTTWRGALALPRR